MIELSKVIEELKIIKNDLRDLPARRLKLIDLLINKYEHLSTSNDMKESRTLLAEQEDREELAHTVKFHYLGGLSSVGAPPAWQRQKYGISSTIN